MKWILPVLIVGWFVGEIATFVVNPFHAPVSQLPMRLFGMQYFKAQDDTMAPTVAPDQYVLITAWPYLRRAPVTGDIVAFFDPDQPYVLQLRRIVAVGASTVAIQDGVTFVNGQRQEEPWLKGQPLKSDRSRTMSQRQVGADHYFMMGDNRDISGDSREWGTIERGAILGRQW
jgi:signal peptidase I